MDQFEDRSTCRRNTPQEEEEQETVGEEEEVQDADEEETVEEEDDDEDEASAQLKDEDAERGADEDDDDDGDNEDDVKKKKKLVTSCPDRKCVPGIVYLGHIPPRLRPRHLRNLLSVYGEVGRIFLQPEDGEVRKRKRRAGSRRSDFVEGWVEFRDKRVAKRVAASLHNTAMGTRKRQHFSSDLWSIKYLHRFQWTHLSERLSLEALSLQQRLRTETSQTKRETNFYLDNVDKAVRMDRKRRHGDKQDDRSWEFTQRQTEDEIQTRKKKKRDSVTQKARDKSRLLQHKSQSNVSLLAKIFNSNQ